MHPPGRDRLNRMRRPDAGPSAVVRRRAGSIQLRRAPTAGRFPRHFDASPCFGMIAEPREPGFPILAAVALLSASALGYEILLTRLFAIVQWHHFAFMVISIALLGIGASGTFLLVLGDRIRLSIGPFLALAALAFAVAAPACYAAAERVPFNVLELPWSLRPFGWLFVIELLGAIPFFLAATGIGRALVVFGDRIPWVYAADLVGAGAGAIAAVGLLAWLPPRADARRNRRFGSTCGRARRHASLGKDSLVASVAGGGLPSSHWFSARAGANSGSPRSSPCRRRSASAGPFPRQPDPDPSVS